MGGCLRKVSVGAISSMQTVVRVRTCTYVPVIACIVLLYISCPSMICSFGIQIQFCTVCVYVASIIDALCRFEGKYWSNANQIGKHNSKVPLLLGGKIFQNFINFRYKNRTLSERRERNEFAVAFVAEGFGKWRFRRILQSFSYHKSLIALVRNFNASIFKVEKKYSFSRTIFFLKQFIFNYRIYISNSFAANCRMLKNGRIIADSSGVFK